MKHPTNPHGWWAGYYPTIMDGAVLRMHPNSCGRFEVNASRSRVGGHGAFGAFGDPRSQTVFTLCDPAGVACIVIDCFEIPHDILNVAWRVHLALKALPLFGSENRLDVIRAAAGPLLWTIDNPAFGETWPPALDVPCLEDE